MLLDNVWEIPAFLATQNAAQWHVGKSQFDPLHQPFKSALSHGVLEPHLIRGPLCSPQVKPQLAS